MLKNPDTHLFISDIASDIACPFIRPEGINMESVHG